MCLYKYYVSFVQHCAGVQFPIHSISSGLFFRYGKWIYPSPSGGGLQLIFGLGAISGPILCSLFMGWFGINGFFGFLVIVHALIGSFGLYRMRIRKTVDNPDSTFTPNPANFTPAGLELDPDTPETLDNSSINEPKVL